jgi:tetratricopeptide (TPR) repeat protein
MKQQDLDTFDEYLKGVLSDQELKDFEQKLQADDQFRARLEQVKLVVAGIRYSARADALEKIKRIENDLQKIKKKKKTIIAKVLSDYSYYIAAACLFLFIMGSLYFFPKSGQKNNGKELFESSFEPYPNIAHPAMRFKDDNLTMVQKAFAEYDRKNYIKAIELFKKAPDFEKDPTIVFYLAISYISINDSEKAERNLLSLLDKHPSINDQVKWYLGICYLKENKTSLAVKYFKDLSETQNYYTQEAIKILKKIK